MVTLHVVGKSNDQVKRDYFCTSLFFLRAYGVVIWEILNFGQLPLPNRDTQDIIKAAQNKRLKHSR